MINHFETVSIGTPLLQRAEKKGRAYRFSICLPINCRPSSCLTGNSIGWRWRFLINVTTAMVAMTFILSLFLEGMETEAVKK